jgi:anti-sigma-K factor RskA
MTAMENTHELAAAYALDALDESDRREFERHLDECAACRDELPALADAAAALALAVEPVAPPAELRGRILSAARAGGEVVPFPRRALPLVSAVAAVAACAAIAFGIWAATLRGDLSKQREARAAEEAALVVLADPAARRVPLAGRSGVLAVRPDGTAALAVNALGRAPSGKTYEAWTIRGDTPAKPAGLFGGVSGRPTLIVLRRPVEKGVTVAVTVERDGGVSSPTTRPILSATA